MAVVVGMLDSILQCPLLPKKIVMYLSITASFSTYSYSTTAQWVLGALSPGIKWPGCHADHSLPFSAEVKNGGAKPPLPHVFSAWCLINETQGQYYCFLNTKYHYLGTNVPVFQELHMILRLAIFYKAFL
jgi:hypothetical protein